MTSRGNTSTTRAEKRKSRELLDIGDAFRYLQDGNHYLYFLLSRRPYFYTVSPFLNKYIFQWNFSVRVMCTCPCKTVALNLLFSIGNSKGVGKMREAKGLFILSCVRFYFQHKLPKPCEAMCSYLCIWTTWIICLKRVVSILVSCLSWSPS